MLYILVARARWRVKNQPYHPFSNPFLYILLLLLLLLFLFTPTPISSPSCCHRFFSPCTRYGWDFNDTPLHTHTNARVHPSGSAYTVVCVTLLFERGYIYFFFFSMMFSLLLFHGFFSYSFNDFHIKRAPKETSVVEAAVCIPLRTPLRPSMTIFNTHTYTRILF